MRILKEQLGAKAESRSLKDFSDINHRVKSEITDLSRVISNLQARMSSFDVQMNKENTEFKISLLERKVEAMAQRVSRLTEENMRKTGVPTTLYSLPSPQSRPSTSKTKMHTRTMSYQNS